MDKSWISGLASFQGLKMPETAPAVASKATSFKQPQGTQTPLGDTKLNMMEQWAVSRGVILDPSGGALPAVRPPTHGIASLIQEMRTMGQQASQEISALGPQQGWLPERTTFMANLAARHAPQQLMIDSGRPPTEALQAYLIAVRGFPVMV